MEKHDLDWATFDLAFYGSSRYLNDIPCNQTMLGRLWIGRVPVRPTAHRGEEPLPHEPFVIKPDGAETPLPGEYHTTADYAAFCRGLTCAAESNLDEWASLAENPPRAACPEPD